MQSPFSYFQRCYNRLKTLAGHKQAEPALCMVAFAESSFFPIPPDIMLIPMAQANHEQAFYYARICLLASVLGGIFGYGIGLLAYNSLGAPLLATLGKTKALENFRQMAQTHGAISIFGAGLTPFPYKVITIMSGALRINFTVFIIASILSRGLRFFLIAACVRRFGDQAESILIRHFGKISLIIFVICLTGWFAYQALS